MAPKKYPTDVLEQAAAVLAACRQISPELKAGTITQAALADQLAQVQALNTDLHSMELQRTSMRSRRDQQLVHIWDVVKRTRSTVKGTYGDDSPEYELVGGTRLSERKRSPRRKAAASAGKLENA